MKKIGKYGAWVPPTLVVLAAPQRAFAQSAVSATLTGYVEDSDTHSRIVGATVSVHCNPTLAIQTNGNGEYTIPNIPPGTWETEWSATNYTTKQEQILYQAGDVIIRNQCMV